jgi:hypothetical protein
MFALDTTPVVQPQYPAPIFWGNPITRGLVFAYLPGRLSDASGRYGMVSIDAPTRVALRGSSILVDGASGHAGLTLSTSAPLLGPLAECSVIALAATTKTIPTSGCALYSERSASGNDIFKLEAVQDVSSGAIRSQFTYRNDGGTLLQVQGTGIPVNMNDGKSRFYAAIRAANGATNNHKCWSDRYLNSATQSGGLAFTNASCNRLIGSDIADSSATWGGLIHLVAGWNRALTDLEIASLYNNPWQLFAPLTTLRFFSYPHSMFSTNVASNFTSSSPNNFTVTT